MRLPLALTFCALVIPLAQCTPVEIEDSLSVENQHAPYPKLAPLDGLLAAANQIEVSEATATNLQNRAAALHARARRLRQENGQ